MVSERLLSLDRNTPCSWLTHTAFLIFPTAICALSPCSEPCYLAYPSPVPSPNSPFAGNNGSADGGVGAGTGGSASSSAGSSGSTSSSGDILIFDLLSLQVSNIIQAHKTSIAHLAINSTGTLLASASDKGTVIRVFSIPSANLVGQYRRGAYPARIYSISFNAVSTLLSVSSDTETVHVFKLPAAGTAAPGGSARPGLLAAGASSPSLGSEDGSSDNGAAATLEDHQQRRKKSTSGGSGGGFKGSLRRTTSALSRLATSSVSGYLPSTFSSLWEPQRDFASLRLPTPGVSSVVAISPTSPHVVVCTSDAFFYVYSLDLEAGGEGTLLKQYSLLDAPGSSSSEQGGIGADENGSR